MGLREGEVRLNVKCLVPPSGIYMNGFVTRLLGSYLTGEIIVYLGRTMEKNKFPY